MQIVTAQAILKPDGYAGDLGILRDRGVTRFGMGVLYMGLHKADFSVLYALSDRDILL